MKLRNTRWVLPSIRNGYGFGFIFCSNLFYFDEVGIKYQIMNLFFVQEKVYSWILSQQEQGARLTVADIVAYLQVVPVDFSPIPLLLTVPCRKNSSYPIELTSPIPSVNSDNSTRLVIFL